MPKNTKRWGPIFLLSCLTLVLSSTGCSSAAEQRQQADTFLDKIDIQFVGWAEVEKRINVGLLPGTTKIFIRHQIDEGRLMDGMRRMEAKLNSVGAVEVKLSGCKSGNVSAEECQINATTSDYFILVIAQEEEGRKYVTTEIVSR